MVGLNMSWIFWIWGCFYVVVIVEGHNADDQSLHQNLLMPHFHQEYSCTFDCIYDQVTYGTLMDSGKGGSMGTLEDYLPHNKCYDLIKVEDTQSGPKIIAQYFTFRSTDNVEWVLEFGNRIEVPTQETPTLTNVNKWGACFNSNDSLEKLYFCQDGDTTAHYLGTSQGNCATSVSCNDPLLETISADKQLVGFKTQYNSVNGDIFDDYTITYAIQAIFNPRPQDCDCSSATTIIINSVLSHIDFNIDQSSQSISINAAMDPPVCGNPFTYALATEDQIVELSTVTSPQIILNSFTQAQLVTYTPNPLAYTLSVTSLNGQHQQDFRFTVQLYGVVCAPTLPWNYVENDDTSYVIENIVPPSSANYEFLGMYNEGCYFDQQVQVDCLTLDQSLVTLISGVTNGPFTFTAGTLEMDANGEWALTSNPKFTINTNDQSFYNKLCKIETSIISYSERNTIAAPTPPLVPFNIATRTNYIKFKLKCILTTPTLDPSYTYNYSKTTPGYLQIEFTESDNDNCAWEESLIILPSTSLPGDGITFTPRKVIDQDFDQTLYFGVEPGLLQIDTQDRCYDGNTLTFQYTIEQLVDDFDGLDSEQLTFDVNFSYDYECSAKTPASVVHDINYDVNHFSNLAQISLFFHDAMVNNCAHDFTLTQISPTPGPSALFSPPFTWTPAVQNVECNLIQSFAQNPKLEISTKDLSSVGTYTFEYKIEASSLGISSIQYFNVKLFAGKCTQIFRGHSLFNHASYNYTVGEDPLLIDLYGVDNNNCQFSIEIRDAITLNSLDPNIFTFVPQIWDKDNHKVLEGAKIIIFTSNSTDRGEYELQIIVHSTRDAQDQEKVSFTFSVDIRHCEPFLSQESSLVDNYVIGEPSLDLILSFEEPSYCFNSEFSVVNKTYPSFGLSEELFEITQNLQKHWLKVTVFSENIAMTGVYEFSLIQTDISTGKTHKVHHKINVVSSWLDLLKPSASQDASSPTDEQIEENVPEEDENGIFAWQKAFKRTKKANSEPLTANITYISPTGNCTVTFNKPILMPPLKLDNYTEIHEQRLDKRELAFGKYDIKEILRVQVRSFYFDEEAEQIKILNFLLFDIREKELDIWIDFNKPNEIASDPKHPDQLEVSFLRGNMFMDSEDFNQLEKNLTLEFNLVPQISLQELEEMEKFEAVMTQSIAAFSIAQLIINLLLSYGLKFLWTMMNTIQFIIFMQMWSIKLPYSSTVLLKTLKMLVLFEFIPSEKIKEFFYQILGMQDDDDDDDIEDELTESTQTIGRKRTESQSLIQNMGMMLPILILLIFLLILLGLAYYLCSKKFQLVKSICMKVQEMVIYNAFLRYAMQSSLKMQISSGSIIDQKIRNPEAYDIQSNQVAISIAISTIYFILPIFFSVVLFRNRDDLETPQLRKKIGSLYLGLIGSSKLVWTYQLVFFLRRFVFVHCVTFALNDHPGIQTQLMCFLIVFQIAFLLQARLHEFTWTKHIEVINELILLILCYHFVLFNQLLDSGNTVEMLGKPFKFFLYLCLAINTCVIVYAQVQQFKAKLKMRKSKVAYYKKLADDLFQAKLDAMKRQAYKFDLKPNFDNQVSEVTVQVRRALQIEAKSSLQDDGTNEEKSDYNIPIKQGTHSADLMIKNKEDQMIELKYRQKQNQKKTTIVSAKFQDPATDRFEPDNLFVLPKFSDFLEQQSQKQTSKFFIPRIRIPRAKTPEKIQQSNKNNEEDIDEDDYELRSGHEMQSPVNKKFSIVEEEKDQSQSSWQQENKSINQPNSFAQNLILSHNSQRNKSLEKGEQRNSEQTNLQNKEIPYSNPNAYSDFSRSHSSFSSRSELNQAEHRISALADLASTLQQDPNHHI